MRAGYTKQHSRTLWQEQRAVVEVTTLQPPWREKLMLAGDFNWPAMPVEWRLHKNWKEWVLESFLVVPRIWCSWKGHDSSWSLPAGPVAALRPFVWSSSMLLLISFYINQKCSLSSVNCSSKLFFFCSSKLIEQKMGVLKKLSLASQL